jgi:ribosomal protein S6--L-glutamate ligase
VYFCFLVEEQYRNDSMPVVILRQLILWEHKVDVLEPQTSITCLSDLLSHFYDAYVLKTVSGGPGLSLLEAAEAIGISTINHSRAIRSVRDKAMVMPQAQGIPTPTTYFLASLHLLNQVPVEQFPLVIKPSNGSSCRNIYYLDDPSKLSKFNVDVLRSSFCLAQHYEENAGFDTKLYVGGTKVFAVAKRSPLHPQVVVEKHPISVTLALHALALCVGMVFGLDVCAGCGGNGSETSGTVVVDINDFPNFSNVPEAEKRVGECILGAMQRVELQPDKIC